MATKSSDRGPRRERHGADERPEHDDAASARGVVADDATLGECDQTLADGADALRRRSDQRRS